MPKTSAIYHTGHQYITLLSLDRNCNKGNLLPQVWGKKCLDYIVNHYTDHNFL